MYRVILLFVVLSVFSCQENIEKNILLVENFEEIKELKGDTLTLENKFIGENDIFIKSKFLIIKNRYEDKDFYFKVYDTKTLNYLGGFAKIGRGPGEFNSIETSGQFEIVDGFVCLWVHEQFKSKLINVEKSLSEKETIIEKKFKHPKSLISSRELVIIDSNNMVGTSMSDKGRFFHYNYKSREVDWSAFYPKTANVNVKKSELHNLYVNDVKSTPNKEIIVSALLYFKRIDILDQRINRKFSIVFKDSPKNPQYRSGPPVPSLMFYYNDLHISDKHIYALNLNVTAGELMNAKCSYNSELHVFTLEGVPIVNYKLDRAIGKIAIDEKNGVFYGLGTKPETEESQLIRYEL